MGIDLRDKNLTILGEGVDVSSGTSSINFQGSGVNVASVGDNVTVTIPGGTGNTTFYLNQSVAQTPYKEFSSIVTSAVEQVVPLTVAGGATSVIAEYMTPTGFPGTTQIPAGLWQLFLHFNAGAVGQNWIIRPTVYKRSSGGTETLLFTADPEIVTGMSTTTTMFTCDGVFPSTTLLTTDRILVRISVENTSGVSQTVNFRTEGSQHYSVVATTLNQVVPSGGGSSAGIFGISNAAGVYTYYATLTLAMAAAVSGNVIEMFADVTETGAVAVTLKTGVNINGNGHTYTLNNSGGTNAFIVTNSTAIECSILNLNVIRIGSTIAQSSNACLFTGTSTSGNIYLTSSKFTNSGSGSAIAIGGSSTIAIYNAVASANTAFGSIYIESSAGAKVYNSTGNSTSGIGINCYLGGDLYSCVGISSSGIGIDGAGANTTGNQWNCTGVSATNVGFKTGLMSVNCVGRSTSSDGISSTSPSKLHNCTGISVSARGISNISSIIYNSQGISSSGVGFLLQASTAVLYNCLSKSESSYSIWGWNGSSVYNSIIECNWNNVGGNGIQGISGFITSPIVNCVFKLSNATAPYLFNGGTAQAVAMRGNTYRGGGAFNVNLTQAITNIEDAQGNIYL